jgi:thiol-disulfide isomerase/thioredoxin
MSTKVIAFVGFLFLLSFPTAAFASAADKIEWHKDFEVARELAKKTGKPMLIDFVADWCKPCHEMERTFWPQPQVLELAKNFVAVSLDFDRRGPEVSRYRVGSIPAVVITDPWGNLLTSRFGYSPRIADPLIQLMQAVPTDFSSINEWNGLLEREKDNPVALVGVADFYRKHGIIELSNSYLKRALKARETKTDLTARGKILIALGINYLKIKDYDEARKTFETYLKEVPNVDRATRHFSAFSPRNSTRKSLAEAEKTLSQLRTSYPNSPLVQQGEQLFKQAASL